MFLRSDFHAVAEQPMRTLITGVSWTSGYIAF